MTSRPRFAFWLAVSCSVGWHLRGLFDDFAQRAGDTGPRSRRTT